MVLADRNSGKKYIGTYGIRDLKTTPRVPYSSSIVGPHAPSGLPAAAGRRSFTKRSVTEEATTLHEHASIELHRDSTIKQFSSVKCYTGRFSSTITNPDSLFFFASLFETRVLSYTTCLITCRMVCLYQRVIKY